MINVYNLWKSYRSSSVLKGLTLFIEAGTTMIILGRSGVGKSVLLRQIIGLEKPDSGFVEVDGLRISDLSPRELYSNMKDFGMLFQSSALFDSMNIEDNVAFYFTEHKGRCTKSELRDRVDDALTKVGLAGYQKKMPSELSGGQKRRAALARLIIYRPKIMLYDEPTTGLDPITAMQINELLAATHEELKATTVIVTHDLVSALTLGDQFAMHHEGKIVSVNNKEDFLQSKDSLIAEFLHNVSLDKLI
jgi:phospholipid/cholesterol/gamma-HCH transport system ATP-binding protein